MSDVPMMNSRNSAGGQSSEWVCRSILPALGGSEMLHARYVRHKFSCHAHSEFVIAGVLEGAESFRHEGRDITAPEGSMILLNPYAEHTGHATGVAWSYVAIYPPSAFVYQSLHGDMRARDGGSLRFKDPIVRDPRLLRQLVALYFAVKSKSADLATQSLFADFMFDLAARHGTYEPANASRFEPAVRTVRERLDADPADNADLAALAAAGGISPLQLLRAFRLSVGCTPQIYRTVQRLRHAKRALIQGQPLAEAAVGAGFYDQSHFTRVFRRWTGSAPGSFAKSVHLGAHGGDT